MPRSRVVSTNQRTLRQAGKALHHGIDPAAIELIGTAEAEDGALDHLLEEQKDAIEQALWNRTQELFAPALDLVLMDTTNTYFHGETRGALAQYGKSKEKRYDRRLISVGLLVTRDGVPMGHEVFPGNLHDAKAFAALLSRLRSRFRIGRVVLCADRGMVSEEILRNLREEGIEYVVGAWLTNTAEDAISYTGANWQDIEGLSIRVKPMGVDGETYVVCHNPKQEMHDRERRKEVLQRLRSQLHKNPSGSSLLRNTSYRSFIRVQGQAITLDEAKVQRSARYDGKYVLRSNADLTHTDIARATASCSRWSAPSATSRDRWSCGRSAISSTVASAAMSLSASSPMLLRWHCARRSPAARGTSPPSTTTTR